MSNEILIVADDLSGAADCGIACAMQGLDAVVSWGEVRVDANVLAIDANTRQMAPEAAARETARVIELHSHDGQLLFKKMDSRLRGHIGPEIAAALEVRRRTDSRAVVVMAPAFPSTGRTTVGGRQHLKGVALDGHVPQILQDAGLRTAHIGLDCIRGGFQKWAANYDALVCDAETEEDLQAIAAGAIALGRGTVWAGSAGLARHLPEAAGLSRAGRPVEKPVAAGPVAIVVGSPSEVAREQAAVLARDAGVVSVQSAEDLRAALDQRLDVLLLLDHAWQAEILAPFADRFAGFVFTGGETARAALGILKVHALRLLREVEAGVPLSVPIADRPRPVITKSGAFGDAGTLLRCRAALRDPK